MSDRATKGGGIVTDMGVMARIVSGVKFVLTGANEAWFGPAQPIAPTAPEEVKGRAFDYPVAVNTNTRPRSTEGVTFQQMRAMADNYDLLRLVIETVKDQIIAQEWTIRPKDPKGKPDTRCDEVKAFFQFPDLEHDHGTWLRMILEDMLVTDAPCLYPRMARGGKLYALETIDGGTIKRVVNADGRTPLPPDPAYQQILKGIPAVDYSRDELIYFPRNLRSNRFYGYSPVEQIIMTVNIALRRQIHQLEFYTEGNTPDLIFGVPSTWQPDQIRQMQLWWDTLINDTASRRKAKFIPGDVKPYDTKEKALKDEYDEWLARVVCFAFSIAPQPFIKEMNRATAATSKEASKEDGKGPRMLWVKRLHDFIIAKYFGYTDLEFGWEDQCAVDPFVQAQIDQIYLASYVIAPDEVRARIGLEGPAPEKPAPPTLTPDPDKETGKPEPEADPVEKVERVKKKPVVAPIDRERATITKARAKFTKKLEVFFKKASADLADQTSVAIEKLNRVDDDDVSRILAELDMNGWSTLIEPAQATLDAIYRDGAHVALQQIHFGDPDRLTSLLNERALQFAEARGAELVGMRNIGSKEKPEWIENPEAKWVITDSTREMLRTDVKTAIDEGWSTGKVKAELKENYAFSSSRAEMIARTEIARADVEGNMQAYRASGIVAGKEWVVGSEHDDDDECTSNAGQGVIGLDEPFESGDDAAPSHPRCVCDILPVLIDSEG